MCCHFFIQFTCHSYLKDSLKLECKPGKCNNSIYNLTSIRYGSKYNKPVYVYVSHPKVSLDSSQFQGATLLNHDNESNYHHVSFKGVYHQPHFYADKILICFYLCNRFRPFMI